MKAMSLKPKRCFKTIPDSDDLDDAEWGTRVHAHFGVSSLLG